MMGTLYHHTIILIVTFIYAFAAGCSSSPGPDSISSHRPHSRGSISGCTSCHNSINSPALDPLVTNGTGTSGKHVTHVQQHGIACERCHYNYQNSATHMNGAFDKGNPALVNMNIIGPAGAWNAAEGSCSGVACHGTATLFWYSTNTWTTPSTCTNCHASVFSPALDPAATNGNPPNGRHAKHVTSRNIGCERCHYQYTARTTHANGLLDTPDTSANLLQFNIVGPVGSWTNDTGAQTGQCANISCHGTDTLEWYGTGTWAMPASCTTCHSSSYSSLLDPLVTNGSDTAGKHINHVTNTHIACSRCHLDYPTMTAHANGYLDTQDAAMLLVYFDALNSSGTWTNDTGPETGNCASLLCHGTDNPEWYGITGVSSPPCAACHGGPIGSRRQIFGANGDFGANPTIISHHVTGGPGSDPLTDQCLVCHEMSVHMGGTVRLKDADSGAAIAYDPASPSTLEPFCLGCHDTNGALNTFISGGTSTGPFNDGKTMGVIPYKMSKEIKTHWNKLYGHKQKGLTCVGNGSPNTGCHSNGHGSAYNGLLSKKLTLPQPGGDCYSSVNESDYELCFTCHASYPNVTKEVVLGMQQGGNYDSESWCNVSSGAYNIPNIMTKFRDVYIGGPNFYDDGGWFTLGHEQLHTFHLQITPAWLYRDSIDSGIVCNTCHNVHGSNTQNGMLFDEMQYMHHDGVGADKYGTMDAPNYFILSNYPVNCAFNCHSVAGKSYNWFEPADE